MIDVDVLYSISAVGSQILVSHGSDDILVDVGDGALRDLVDRRYEFSRLKGILITHEHFEHTCGLYAIMNFMRLLDRRDELLIVIPKPVKYVDKLLKPPIMYEESTHPVKTFEVSHGDSMYIGDLQISMFEVDHRGSTALGYSIKDSDGFKVVFSGDTRPCDNLKHDVSGADIAVLECTFEDGYEEFAKNYGHMTRSEAENIGREAKKIIFTHSSPISYLKKIKCASR